MDAYSTDGGHRLRSIEQFSKCRQQGVRKSKLGDRLKDTAYGQHQEATWAKTLERKLPSPKSFNIRNLSISPNDFLVGACLSVSHPAMLTTSPRGHA